MNKEQLAREAYQAYGEVTDFKNFQGNPMPKWEDLPEKIQQAWQGAVTKVVSLVISDWIDVVQPGHQNE